MTGVKITSLVEETVGWLIARERLWVTEDGKRLVPDLHPDAASLFVGARHRISLADAERFGLLEDGHDVAALQAVPAEAADGGLSTEAPEPVEQEPVEQDPAEQDPAEHDPSPKPQPMGGRRRGGKVR